MSIAMEHDIERWTAKRCWVITIIYSADICYLRTCIMIKKQR